MFTKMWFVLIKNYITVIKILEHNYSSWINLNVNQCISFALQIEKNVYSNSTYYIIFYVWFYFICIR